MVCAGCVLGIGAGRGGREGITVCKQGMTVFSKTLYTEFHEAFPASHVQGRAQSTIRRRLKVN